MSQPTHHTEGEHSFGEQETKVAIHSDADIVAARQKGRDLAIRIGFTTTDAILIATSISELARNILRYAGHGEIVLKRIERDGQAGIAVIAQDDGPGISNIPQAMEDGFSTSGSLGLGLPGVRRLMDEFDIVSEPGHGTRVIIKKWKR